MRAIVQFEGLATRFHIEDERDHIQEFHGRGEFYELRHLLIQRDLIHRRSSVIDVGANVGNHTLFYSQHTNAVRVYPLEANPAAVRDSSQERQQQQHSRDDRHAASWDCRWR